MKINDVVTENLHKWFKEKWVRFGPDGKIKGPCARGSSKEGKPKCLPQAKAHSLGKKKRATAARRKRREDPNPNRSGKAHNVRTEAYDYGNMHGVAEIPKALLKHGWVKRPVSFDKTVYKKKGVGIAELDRNQAGFVRFTIKGHPYTTYGHEEAIELLNKLDPIHKGTAMKEEYCPECGGSMYPEIMINEKKDACYYKVKSRYKVWPSAYASGALVKCRKKGAKNWGNKSESINESRQTIDSVRNAIIQRILHAHDELISAYGLDKVSKAIDDVAEEFGDNDLQEIGSSDVTAFVKMVVDNLKNHPTLKEGPSIFSSSDAGEAQRKYKAAPAGLKKESSIMKGLVGK